MIEIIPLIANQKFIVTESDFDELQPPQHGLFLLGTFPETGFLVSVRAYGRIAGNASSLGKNVRGILLFCLIRNSSNGPKVIAMFDARKVLTKEKSFLGTITSKMFDNEQHPMKGDSFAVYIPEKPVLDNNNKFHPLGIVMDKNSSIKVWRNVGFNKMLGKLKNGIKTTIEQGSSSRWEDVGMAMELNVEVKMIYTFIRK